MWYHPVVCQADCLQPSHIQDHLVGILDYKGERQTDIEREGERERVPKNKNKMFTKRWRFRQNAISMHVTKSWVWEIESVLVPISKQSLLLWWRVCSDYPFLICECKKKKKSSNPTQISDIFCTTTWMTLVCYLFFWGYFSCFLLFITPINVFVLSFWHLNIIIYWIISYL